MNSDYLDERTRVALTRLYLTCTGFLLALGDKAKRKLYSLRQGLGIALGVIPSNREIEALIEKMLFDINTAWYRRDYEQFCKSWKSSSGSSQAPKPRMSELAAELSKEPKLLTWADLENQVVLSQAPVTVFSVDRETLRLQKDLII